MFYAAAALLALALLLIAFLTYKIRQRRANVFVMAPLDLIDHDCHLKDSSYVHEWLVKLHKAKVDGVMVDVWWGLVEQRPHDYKWTGYVEFFSMCSMNGLKIVPVLSFHKCGGNVGDSNTIDIPKFVRNSNQHFFVDQFGNIDDEYISPSYDDIVVDEERTPLQMYQDFMKAFADRFEILIKRKVIENIEVGLGPCGELRYPSYQLDKWNYPGGGALQCFDEQSLLQLKSDAPCEEFAVPPIIGDDYNSSPENSEFWKDEKYKTEHAKFFFKWYNQQLVNHADRVLSLASHVFKNTRISGKIAGIHWWYMHDSHCAEATAGLFNYQNFNGYRNIIATFAKHRCNLCFTCLEMTPNSYFNSDPVSLVHQVVGEAKRYNLRIEGENALECYDQDCYRRILNNINLWIKDFTFLRMTDTLMKPEFWSNFCGFVTVMHHSYLRKYY